MHSKCLFVVNPKSGNGQGLKVWPKIEHALKNKGIDYQIEYTAYKYHAATLVKEGIEAGCKRVIAIGGDGTLHECLSGIYLQSTISPSEIELGIYPVGTGNDWIKSHPVPRDIDKWLSYLECGNTIVHDVGKVTYQHEGKLSTRHFINIAGLGFEAAAVERACRQGNELLGGKLYYLLVVAKTLFSYNSQPMTITIDDEIIQGTKFCVTVGLNKYNGGGMQLLPHADATDGYFDVAIIDQISVGEVLFNLPKLYNGKIVHHPKMRSIRAKTIEITSAETVLLEADGEYLGSTRVQFEIIKHGVKIMRP